ncbi:transposase [Arcanobacterium phocisimile]|uniref:Transposase n=1 Tax=Arcanobacterium phocisimile TaxID=1302235 RepID=A0ABX7IHK5_9ACTO|nr:IS3 family transposase [Arcanobacterium phocisimile]QRV02542.1 transposase [Arcanobacterium phocisimile]
MQREKVNYFIARMVRLLKVSRSYFYAWAKKQAAISIGDDEKTSYYQQLDEKIYRMWERSDKVYGTPRITADLHAGGVSIDKKTVAKRMKLMGIEGISPRKCVPSKKVGDASVAAIPVKCTGFSS